MVTEEDQRKALDALNRGDMLVIETSLRARLTPGDPMSLLLLSQKVLVSIVGVEHKLSGYTCTIVTVEKREVEQA